MYTMLATGDIDGDGLTDIITPGNSIRIWFQEAGGTLKTPVDFAVAATSEPMAMTVADMDNDGSVNLLVAGYYDFRIYEWSGGTLVNTYTIPDVGSYLNTGVTTNDFDGDGWMDIALVNKADNKIAVIFRKGEGVEWEVRYYDDGSQAMGMITSGAFDTLSKPGVIRLSRGNMNSPVKVTTFTNSRTIQNRYDLELPEQSNKTPQSATVVRKGPGKPSELWVAFGGNRPDSKIAIWKGLQTMPDTSFEILDIPGVIASANLDCDEDDEPVVLNDAWMAATVISDTINIYPVPYTGFPNNSLSLADVNNDGLIDICFTYYSNGIGVLYNHTPACLPTTGITTAGIVADDKLSVYPNPANEAIEIAYKGSGKLMLTDMQGRLLQQCNHQQKTTIDLTKQPAGLYMLKLLANDGQVLTRKISKY